MSSAIESKNVRQCRRSLSSSNFSNVILRTPGSEVHYDDLVHRLYSSAKEAVPMLPRTHSSSNLAGGLSGRPYSLLTHPMYDQPSGRHYETYAPGGWASPIYQYLYKTQRQHFNPELPGRVSNAYRHRSQEYLREARSLAYHPAQKSIDYYQSDLDRAVDSHRRWSLGVVSTHPYYRDYFGNSGLRHFAGYRPRHVQHYLRAVWIS